MIDMLCHCCYPESTADAYVICHARGRCCWVSFHAPHASFDCGMLEAVYNRTLEWHDGAIVWFCVEM